MKSVIKFVTKAITYFVKDGKVTQARSNETGRFIKRVVAQTIHDKLTSAAKSFSKFLTVNKLKAQTSLDQLTTHLKSFGFNIVCLVEGKSRLTLKTLLNS